MSELPLGIDAAFSVRGQVVLLTGALGWIGETIAEVFGANGAHVAASDHPNRFPLAGPWHARNDVVGRLRAKSADMLFVPADLADPAQLKDLVAKTVARFGRLDALVHCGGLPASRPVCEGEDGDFDHLFHINLRSAWILARAAIGHLEKTQGCIVNIASVNGHRPMFAGALYAASKAGVISLSREMANEFGPRMVRVNTVSPGPIANMYRQTARILEDLHEPYVAQCRAWLAAHPDEIGKSYQPLARGGRPVDVAMACVYLCAPAARYVNGADVLVDGGHLHQFGFGGGMRRRDDTFWPPFSALLKSFPPEAWKRSPPEWVFNR